MNALFEPRVVRTRGPDATLELLLEPQQAYLDHHRPGGEPLFSTVLGLEAIASAVRLLEPGAAPGLADVRVGPPCIATGMRVLPVRIEACRPAGQGRLECALHGAAEAGGQRVHLAARHVLAGTLPVRAAVARCGRGAVGSREVYEHFFHGPAFRVVGAAQWRPGHLLAEMAPGLPPLRTGGGYRTWLAPRLLELGLQAAGLLELARSGRMRIPAGIGSVWVAAEGGRAPEHGCRALAVERTDEGTDILVVGATGEPLVAIEDYRTVPLPFADNVTTRERLHAALRASLPVGTAQGT